MFFIFTSSQRNLFTHNKSDSMWLAIAYSYLNSFICSRCVVLSNYTKPYNLQYNVVCLSCDIEREYRQHGHTYSISRAVVSQLLFIAPVPVNTNNTTFEVNQPIYVTTFCLIHLTETHHLVNNLLMFFYDISFMRLEIKYRY